jgi:hypothetical protein
MRPNHLKPPILKARSLLRLPRHPGCPPLLLSALIGFFFVLWPCARASTPLTGTPLNDGYHALYNLDFASAHTHFQQWITDHPEDPLGPASDAAAYIFTEFDRLGVLDIELFADDGRFESRKRPAIDPAIKQGFNDRIAQSERLADAAIERNPRDANAFYCKAVTSGMQADWASLIDRHEYGAYKFSELASKNAKQALALNPTLYDANLAIGIENYMLSLKPAPIRWILGMAGAGTNKDEGVRLLKLTAEQGHYLAPFARLMLAVGELRDGRTQQGKAILMGLSQEFPQNTLYQRQIGRLH